MTPADGVVRIEMPAGGGVAGQPVKAYLVGRRSFVLVDPGDPTGPALERAVVEAAERGGTIRAIALTHVDPDHAAGAEALAEQLGIPVLVGPGGGRPLPYDVRELADGEVIDAGDVPLRVVSTPGPRPDHLAFVARRGRRRPGRRPRRSARSADAPGSVRRGRLGCGTIAPGDARSGRAASRRTSRGGRTWLSGGRHRLSRRHRSGLGGRLRSVPAATWLFVALAVGDDDPHGPGHRDDRPRRSRGARLRRVRGVPTAIAFLLPAALFLRHRDVWQTDRLLVVGTVLFGVVEVLQYISPGVSDWLASLIPAPPDVSFLAPLPIAFGVVVGHPRRDGADLHRTRPDGGPCL